jgi:hypothetical protein
MPARPSPISKATRDLMDCIGLYACTWLGADPSPPQPTAPAQSDEERDTDDQG